MFSVVLGKTGNLYVIRLAGLFGSGMAQKIFSGITEGEVL